MRQVASSYRLVVKALLIVLLAAMCSKLSLAAEAAKALPDVRVLIDISGSMKRNDPENLRIPALKLLVDLLPPNAKAGVWTFGQYVNMIVPHGIVTESWKNRARAKANEINSVGLYTDIAEVLQTSAFDVTKPDPSYYKTYIVLTDGMIDISRDPDDNLRSKTNIVSNMLPRFVAVKVPIHTVALSDKADQDLMRLLAYETGGQALVATSADDLMRIFLQLFDKTVPVETVPLKEGNTFLIDSSIEEFTALVFRQPNTPTTRIVSPSKETFEALKYPGHVKWFSEQAYDLVTVNQPLEGEWRLDAKLAPNTRVTVVSNLSLKVTDLPSNVYEGSIPDLEVSFEDENGTVTSPDFLGLLEIKVTVKLPGGKSRSKVLSRGGQVPSDGIYRSSLSVINQPGKYDVIISVDGKTFQRERRQRVNFVTPISVETDYLTSPEPLHELLVLPLIQNVDIAQSEVIAQVTDPDGGRSSLRMQGRVEDWRLTLPPIAIGTAYQVQVIVNGVTLAGGEFAARSDVVELRQTVAPPKIGKPAASAAPSPPVEAILEPDPLSIDPEPVEPEPDSEGNDYLLWGSLVVGNGLIFALAFWAYKRFVKKRESDELALDELEEELAKEQEEVEAGSPQDQEPPPPVPAAEPEPEAEQDAPGADLSLAELDDIDFSDIADDDDTVVAEPMVSPEAKQELDFDADDLLQADDSDAELDLLDAFETIDEGDSGGDDDGQTINLDDIDLDDLDDLERK